MIRRHFQALLCGLVLVASSQRVLAQTTQPDSIASAKRFAQSFYDWYTPLARRDSLPRLGSTTAEIAIRQKPEVFSGPLLAALRADFNARARGNEGLDFDPFNLTQDTPCEHYQAGKVSREHNSYRVDVHAVCDGKLTDSVYVVAEVQPVGSSWQFVNFRYPGMPKPDDLIGVLKFLKDQRRAP